MSTSGRLHALRGALEAHDPADAREAASRQRILALLDWLPAPLDEHADPTHVTASAIVIDERGRVLLHRHKRLGTWLQPGGHLGPDEDPPTAALRETREETGVDAAHPGARPTLVHVDVHEGPRGHVHLDLRYLVVVDGSVALRPAAGESEAVAWWEAADVLRVADHGLATAVMAGRRRLGLTDVGVRTAAGGAPPRRATGTGRPPRS